MLRGKRLGRSVAKGLKIADREATKSKTIIKGAGWGRE